jgi:hypothetical protein
MESAQLVITAYGFQHKFCSLGAPVGVGSPGVLVGVTGNVAAATCGHEERPELASDYTLLRLITIFLRTWVAVLKPEHRERVSSAAAVTNQGALRKHAPCAPHLGVCLVAEESHRGKELSDLVAVSDEAGQALVHSRWSGELSRTRS